MAHVCFLCTKFHHKNFHHILYCSAHQNKSHFYKSNYYRNKNVVTCVSFSKGDESYYDKN